MNIIKFWDFIGFYNRGKIDKFDMNEYGDDALSIRSREKIPIFDIYWLVTKNN